MREPGHSDTKQAKKLELHVCPTCGSEMVQPTCWEQVEGRVRWRIWRRCPECEWRSEGIHDETEIDVFDEQLDIGADLLAEELKDLEHANMKAMVEAFAVGLDADLIGADDFQ